MESPDPSPERHDSTSHGTDDRAGERHGGPGHDADHDGARASAHRNESTHASARDGERDGASRGPRAARGSRDTRTAPEHDRPRVRVFVEGRYRKLTRDLPQTVFFCPECRGHPRRRRGCARCEGFGKLTRDSVQELVGWVLGAAFQTRRNTFHGSGREDVDVRMLGDGRPFVVELENPKVLDVDLAAVEAEINRRNAGRLEVRGLHWSDKARVRVLKEEPHAKEYEALVVTAARVDPSRWAPLVGRRLTVVQQTPARVAHRRADKERTRWIEFLAFEPVDGEDLVRVRMRTEHGTYVKEAVHGEGGATRPSLSELLGVPCTCRELDVLSILDAGGEKPPEPPKPIAFGANLLD